VAGAGILALLRGGRLTTVPLLVGALAVFGLGLGTAIPNLMAAALGSVPVRRTGSAAGVFLMSRYAGSITTSVAISIFVTSDASGSRLIFGLSSASMIVPLLVATRLPKSLNSARSSDPAVRADAKPTTG
jgi:MFS family permease